MLPRSLCKKSLLVTLLLFIFCVAQKVIAATALELQQQIQGKNTSIEKLDKEIADYTAKATATGAQTQTLQHVVSSLDATRKKLDLDIKQSQTKVERAELTLQALSIQIRNKEEKMKADRAALAEGARQLRMHDADVALERLMLAESVSQLLDRSFQITTFTERVRTHLHDVVLLRAALHENKTATEKERAELLRLKNLVADQKKIADDTRAQQAKLLTQTKNQEKAYKQLVQKKLAEKAAVEKEILMYESQLKVVLDQSRLPTTKKGILSWPVAKVRVTQHFGNTEFSRANTSVYNGKGHNGIDLAASVGTPILSALSGIVKGVGDTDLTCQGASYGKWVLVEHPNGLSTLYAHLSLIKASQGQSVSTGDLLGYSGQTGYSTGPHVHFSLYASQGVQIGQLKSKVPSCGTYTLPIASLNSYFNPEEYL